MQSDSYRVFAAINVSPEAMTEVASFVDRLRQSLPEKSVRWVRVDQIHLTLKFYGDVELASMASLVDALRLAVAGQAPFSLECGSPGCFPSDRKPRVLWLGLDGDIEVLHRLQRSVAARTSGWDKKSNDRFHPHLTVGRVKTTQPKAMQAIVRTLQTVQPPQRVRWLVSGLSLMRSVLAPGGSRYTVLATIPFSTSGNDTIP